MYFTNAQYCCFYLLTPAAPGSEETKGLGMEFMLNGGWTELVTGRRRGRLAIGRDEK